MDKSLSILKTSGIYKIVNIANDRYYIGSTNNLRQRMQAHTHHLMQNRHANQHLQNAWNKYGEHSFKFEVIEYCEEQVLLQREQYYIDTLLPVYNKRILVHSNQGLKKTVEAIEKTASKLRGRKKSQESIEKTRVALLGRKRCPLLVERIASKVRHRPNLKNSKAVVQLTMDGNFIAKWDSITQASCEVFGNKSSVSNISGCCIGKYKQYGQHIWLHDADYINKAPSQLLVEIERRQNKGKKLIHNHLISIGRG